MGTGAHATGADEGAITRAPRLVRHVLGGQAAYAIHMVDQDARGDVLGYTPEPVSPLFASVEEMRCYLEWLLLTGLDCMGQGEAAYLVGRAGICSWLGALKQPLFDAAV